MTFFISCLGGVLRRKNHHMEESIAYLSQPFVVVRDGQPCHSEEHRSEAEVRLEPSRLASSP